MSSSLEPASNENHKKGFYTLHEGTRQISSAPVAEASKETFTQLLYENERIAVYDFRLPAGESVIVSHELPTIRWQVDEGQHRLIVQDQKNGKEDSSTTTMQESTVVPDRKVFFVSPGTQWTLTNTSNNGTYRQILFVLQSAKPKYSEQQVKELLDQAIYTTDVGTELMLENELCRVWDFYLEPGEGGGADTVHHHCLDYVFINVAPSRLLGLHPQTLDLDNLLFDSVSTDNQVTWNYIPEQAGKDTSFAHGGKNGYDDRPMREYLIELK